MDRARRDVGLRSLVAAMVMLVGASARADVVGPPPASCAVGSQGNSCHGGSYCAPIRCTDAAACPSGTTCQEVKWCIAQVNCASGWNPTPYYVDDVKGPCAAGGQCSSGTCQSRNACLPKSSQGDSAQPPGDGAQPPSRGCTCSLTEAGGDAGAPLWGLLVAGLVLGWRRMGPRSTR